MSTIQFEGYCQKEDLWKFNYFHSSKMHTDTHRVTVYSTPIGEEHFVAEQPDRIAKLEARIKTLENLINLHSADLFKLNAWNRNQS